MAPFTLRPCQLIKVTVSVTYPSLEPLYYIMKERPTALGELVILPY